MTFNIQHGIDGTSRYNLQRAIDTVARVQPDIVGLQEVTRNHPSYACDDQPAKIASGLRAATGATWNVIYEQEWFTPDVSCQNSGRGTGPETEGLAFVARLQLASPTVMQLTDSRIGYAASLPDAYRLPVLVTHLTSGSANASVRSQQIGRLLAWAGGFGEPRILMGDFNAASDKPEMQPLVGAYRDAWSEARRLGAASGDGSRNGSPAIDYILYEPGNALALESAEFVDTVPLIGVAASDHKPLVATFTIR
jgi:endonuclease/exonuclease/phosphatase family metal-dependent hydrolase